MMRPISTCKRRIALVYNHSSSLRTRLKTVDLFLDRCLQCMENLTLELLYQKTISSTETKRRS